MGGHSFRPPFLTRRRTMDNWKCAACGGDVYEMGILGTLQHGGCRNCGLTQHRRLPDENERPSRAQHLRFRVEQARQALQRAEAELSNLVHSCPHLWGEPQYVPEIREGYWEPSSGNGVDRLPGFQVPRQEKPKWRRTCALCGLVQETTRVETPQPKSVPSFS